MHGTHEHELSHGLKINFCLTSTKIILQKTNLTVQFVVADPTNLEGLAGQVVEAVAPTSLEDLDWVVEVVPTNLED